MNHRKPISPFLSWSIFWKWAQETTYYSVVCIAQEVPRVLRSLSRKLWIRTQFEKYMLVISVTKYVCVCVCVCLIDHNITHLLSSFIQLFYIFEWVYGKKSRYGLFPFPHHFFPNDLIMLPIIAGSCPQVNVSVSSPQWDILETGLCIEREVVRFTRNDSRSVLGENWAFHNLRDQHLTQERRVRWVALPQGEGGWGISAEC